MYFGMKLKTCFADMLMFIVAKIKKIDISKIRKFINFIFCVLKAFSVWR